MRKCHRELDGRQYLGGDVVALKMAVWLAVLAACTAEIPRMMKGNPRLADALSGTGFAEATAGLPMEERQAAALGELSRGNVPGFLRELVAVELPVDGGVGDECTATVWVTPDYLSIGSEEDFLRMPLGLPTAAAAAREWGMLLPTCKIVDAVWDQAAVRLEPQPMTPGPEMMSNDYLLRHQRLVEEQRGGRGTGELIAGHKKDVVISKRLGELPGRVAIYGWHQPDGHPIQPLSTAHVDWYADYSHGVRLVHPEAQVNGESVSLLAALQNPELAGLFSDEGVIDGADELMQDQAD